MQVMVPLVFITVMLPKYSSLALLTQIVYIDNRDIFYWFNYWDEYWDSFENSLGVFPNSRLKAVVKFDVCT